MASNLSMVKEWTQTCGYEDDTTYQQTSIEIVHTM